MANTSPRPTKTGKVFGIPAKVIAVLAIAAGAMSCVERAIKGHSASQEDIMVFAAPAVVGALIAIAAERSVLTYVALGFGLLGIVAVVLG
jgi:hypothetical protein